MKTKEELHQLIAKSAVTNTRSKYGKNMNTIKYVVSINAPNNKYSIAGKKDTKAEAETLKVEMEKQGYTAKIVKTKRNRVSTWN